MKMEEFMGNPESEAQQTVDWLKARSANTKVIEVRGTASGKVKSIDGLLEIDLDQLVGSNQKAGHFVCASCGFENRQIDAFSSTGTTAPIAAYALQGYSHA
ncbi:hypothetical protein FLP41_14090 [Paracoccus marcusii]|uniref:hypothetical protein n=1 Tax=Paracoccus marcusii TaxID=59779 RepID=UPI002ED3DE31|nr:hypothetical protein FLP41_14090 [Paracoccus marcusii]